MLRLSQDGAVRTDYTVQGIPIGLIEMGHQDQPRLQGASRNQPHVFKYRKIIVHISKLEACILGIVIYLFIFPWPFDRPRCVHCPSHLVGVVVPDSGSNILTTEIAHDRSPVVFAIHTGRR